MAALTDSPRTGEYIVSESKGYRSREEVTVDATGGAMDAGTILGLVTTAGATVAIGTNTGDGVLTKDATTPVLSGAAAGVYNITFIEASTDDGQYQVEAPDGHVIGIANIDDVFADQIKFVIADGAADFVVGDSFTITVAAGSLKYVAHVNAAIDGSEVAVAVLYEGIGAVEGLRTITIRDAEVAGSWLTYDAAGTVADINAELAAVGIVVR